MRTLVQLADEHNYATLGTMKNLSHAVAALLITAWVGALWAIGYLAAPVLFYAQPDRQLAGMLAGQMFGWVNYLGMACAAYLLIYRYQLFGRIVLRQPLFWIVVGMLLITLTLQFGIQPVIADLKTQALPANIMDSAFAARFRMLHGISSILYLIASLLGVLLVIKPRHIFQG